MSVHDSPDWPVPPVDIKIIRRSGETIPVECVFSTWHGDTAIWEVLWSGDHLDFSAGDVLTIGELPAKTALVLTQRL